MRMCCDAGNAFNLNRVKLHSEKRTLRVVSMTTLHHFLQRFDLCQLKIMKNMFSDDTKKNCDDTRHVAKQMPQMTTRGRSKRQLPNNHLTCDLARHKPQPFSINSTQQFQNKLHMAKLLRRKMPRNTHLCSGQCCCKNAPDRVKLPSNNQLYKSFGRFTATTACGNDGLTCSNRLPPTHGQKFKYSVALKCSPTTPNAQNL